MNIFSITFTFTVGGGGGLECIYVRVCECGGGGIQNGLINGRLFNGIYSDWLYLGIITHQGFLVLEIRGVAIIR